MPGPISSLTGTDNYFEDFEVGAQYEHARGKTVTEMDGVLITNIEYESSREVAERLLKLVREQRFDWEDRHYSLSASIGVVFIDEGTPNADAAMRSADEACYAAKDAGRNRVCAAIMGG